MYYVTLSSMLYNVLCNLFYKVLYNVFRNNNIMWHFYDDLFLGY